MIMAISVACVLSVMVFFLFLSVSLVAMTCNRGYFCGLCTVCHGLFSLPLGVTGSYDL